MASQKLEIKLKTLTPLWTGGVEAGQMDRLHETGIIGSLRWWYEAIVRGLGGDVCDPTSDIASHRCIFDTKGYEQARQQDITEEQALQTGLTNVCAVCRLFGCTGWKRRFQLAVEPTIQRQQSNFWLATLDSPGKFNHWWLGKIFGSAIGHNLPFVDMALHVSFAHGYAERYESVLKALLSIMARYGAIGAKPQYGFGQFEYPEKLTVAESIEVIRQHNVLLTTPKSLTGDYYSLQEFWHIRSEIPETVQQVKAFKQANVIGDAKAFNDYKNLYLPVSFDIRYKLPQSNNKGLRQAYRSSHHKKQTRQVFGTLIDDKRGSRIFVSHLFKKNDADRNYWLHVWGFNESDIGREIQAYLQEILPEAKSHKTSGLDILEGRG